MASPSILFGGKPKELVKDSVKVSVLFNGEVTNPKAISKESEIEINKASSLFFNPTIRVRPEITIDSIKSNYPDIKEGLALQIYTLVITTNWERFTQTEAIEWGNAACKEYQDFIGKINEAAEYLPFKESIRLLNEINESLTVKREFFTLFKNTPAETTLKLLDDNAKKIQKYKLSLKNKIEEIKELSARSLDIEGNISVYVKSIMFIKVLLSQQTAELLESREVCLLNLITQLKTINKIQLEKILESYLSLLETIEESAISEVSLWKNNRLTEKLKL